MRALMMIPRHPPARLEGGSWSQYLRDFVSFCLNEMPEDRHSAEELLRSKLVKSSIKSPTSVLRDLVIRLDLWQRKGGIRQSLAGGLDGLDMDALGAEGENNNDDNAWDFETVSSRTGFPFNRPKAINEDPYDLLAESSETVKPVRYHTPSSGPLKTPRTDHPLLQLFSEKATPSTTTSPPYQRGPTYQPSGLPKPVEPQHNIIEIPDFDSDSGSTISNSGFMQIEIPDGDDLSSFNQPAPFVPAVQPLITNVIAPTPPASEKSEKGALNRSQRMEPTVALTNSVPASPARIKQTPSRDPSPRRHATTASAPSSPPRIQAFTHAMPSNAISNSSIVIGGTAHKSHHSATKSAPNVSLVREKVDVPPIPSIGEMPKIRSADSTPLSKQRSQLHEGNQSLVGVAANAVSTAVGAPVMNAGIAKAYGAKRAELSLKLPAATGPVGSIPGMPSPNRYPSSPLAGSSNNTPYTPATAVPMSAASYISHSPFARQQPVEVPLFSNFPEMPNFAALNMNVLRPDASAAELNDELSRMVSQLDIALGVLGSSMQYAVDEIKRDDNQRSRRSGREKRPRGRGKQSDTEGGGISEGT